VTVIPGRSEESIVVVAHRDNAGLRRPSDDNTAATAALIELARGFAPQETGADALFERTLVLVSTDGGAYGGAGARHFARESPYAAAAIAVIVLDGIDRRGDVRIAIAGDDPVSPARALVRTAAARIEEETSRSPTLPSVLTQLVDLAIPYAAREQGPFLAEGVAAITIGAGDVRDAAVPDDLEAPQVVERLGQLGRASEAIVGSIDASVGAAFRTPDSLFLDDRAASGWAIRLALVVAVAPFVLGVVDLLVRVRRRRIPLAGAVRALRTRLVFWLFAGALLWLGAVLGVFPTGAPLALPPGSPPVSDWPIAGLALLVIAALLGWLTARRRLVAAPAATPDERLAGYSVGLAWIGVVAVLLALTKPYALVFVLPSLYTWLWLPLRSRLWTRVALYAAGFLGPVAGLAVLCRELGIGPLDGLLYVASLATVGYLSLGSVLAAIAWLAAAGQLGALALGRYAPYAGGAVPPPPGMLRGSVARLARYVSAR
jgi:hypothetical protein